MKTPLWRSAWRALTALAVTAVPWQAFALPGDVLESVALAQMSPRDVSATADGGLWVVDSGANSAVLLSADGSTVSTEFSTSAFGATDPAGIALASDGTLFIVDNASVTMHHRNSDGSAASVPTVDLSTLGLSDPLGIDALGSGNLIIVDGAAGSMTAYVIPADGSTVVSSFDLSAIFMSSPHGVAEASDGTLWLTDEDFAYVFQASAGGSFLGGADVSALGLVSAAGLGMLSDDTMWTIDAESATLVHHDAGGSATGSPATIVFNEAVGLNLTGVAGITRDPLGLPWIVDTATTTVHRLNNTVGASIFSFDFSSISADISEIDMAPDGTLYLTDEVNSTIHRVSPNGSSVIGTITAAQLGVTTIGAIALNPDGGLWVLDPFTLKVHSFDLDGSNGVERFTLSGIPSPRDIEFAPDGTLWIADAQASASRLVHLNQDGSSAGSVPSLSVGASLGLNAPESVARYHNGDILVVDSSQHQLLKLEGPPPVIAQAIHVDVALPVGVSAGDELVLVFDQPVSLGGTLESDDFTLPLAGDSLGAFTAAASAVNPTHITLTLGAGVSLTIPGSGALSSSIDVSASMEAGDIVDSATLTDVSPSSARDIQFAMIDSGLTVIGPAGGSVAVTDSDNAVYRKHVLTIDPGALASDIGFALTVPSSATGYVNAVEVNPYAFDFPLGGATLTLGYSDQDLFNGAGGDEGMMRIHQLVPIGGGDFVAVLVSGEQTVDTDENTVEVPLNNTDPANSGTPTLFATLPLDTLDERSITIAPEETADASGPATSGLSGDPTPGAVLSVGPGWPYSQHRLAFPGYVEAEEGVTVTLRPANLFERYGFPPTSNAIYTIETTDAIETPIEVTVEFRPQAGADVTQLNGGEGHHLQMRLVRSFGQMEGFAFADEATTDVEVPMVVSFEVNPPSGAGVTVFGAAADPSQIPAELTLFIAD